MIDEEIVKEYAKKYALLYKGIEEDRRKIAQELSERLNTIALLERDIEDIKVFVVKEPGNLERFVFNFKELGV